MIPPVPDSSDPRFAPFWERTRRHELSVQRCLTCATPRWPPRPICGACHGSETEWWVVRPRGVLYSWTVVGHQTVPEIPVPYTVGLIELEEPTGVRFLGRVVDADPASLTVGTPVRAIFEAVTDEVTLVYWTPDDPASDSGSARGRSSA